MSKPKNLAELIAKAEKAAQPKKHYSRRKQKQGAAEPALTMEEVSKAMTGDTKGLDKGSASSRTKRIHQRLFAQHYLMNGFNATQAMLLVRPKLKRTSASSIGATWLQSEPVRQYLAQEVQGMFARNNVSEDFLVELLKNQSLANVMDYFETDEATGHLEVTDLKALPEWVQRNIRQLQIDNQRIENEEGTIINQKIRIQMVDSQGAADKLAKYLGLYNEDSSKDNASERAERLGQALNRVAKVRPVTIDNDTGEPLHH